MRTPTKPHTVAYLRTNDGSVEKLQAQRDVLLAWAALASVAIVEWHSDCSSANADLESRPGLQRAIERARGGVLLVARPDVLARSHSVAAELAARVWLTGATIQYGQGGPPG